MGGQITGSAAGDTGLLTALAVIGTVATSGALAETIPVAAGSGAALGAGEAALGAGALGTEAAVGAGTAGLGAGLGSLGTAGAVAAPEVIGGAGLGLTSLEGGAGSLLASGGGVGLSEIPTGFAAIGAGLPEAGTSTAGLTSMATPSFGLEPLGVGSGSIDTGAGLGMEVPVGMENISQSQMPWLSKVGGSLPSLDQTYKGAALGSTALGAGKALLGGTPPPKGGAVSIPSGGPSRGPTAKSSIDQLQRVIEERRKAQNMPWVRSR